MKTNLKRIGAWALCFMLLFSCIPVSADDGLITARDYSAGYSLDSATWANAGDGIYLGYKDYYISRQWKVPVYYYYLDAVQNPVLSSTTQTLSISYNGNTTISTVPSDIDGSFYGAKVATSANAEAVGTSTSNDVGLYLTAQRSGSYKDGYTYTLLDAPSNDRSNTKTVLSDSAENLTGSDYAVYVRYTPSTVTATFDTDGGSTVDSITNVQPGTEITLPDAPTKDGYTFLGWSDGTSVYEANYEGYILSADTTFTAQWAENVELTYYRDDELIHRETSYIGAKIYLYSPEFNDLDERTVFDGWTDSNGALINAEDEYTVTEAMSFTAHFMQGIQVDLDPGTEGTFGDDASINVLIIPNGDTFGMWEGSFPTPDSTVEGKVFSHWKDSDGTVVTSSYVFTGDTTFTAFFVEQSLEIQGDSHYVLVGDTLQLEAIGTNEQVTWSSENEGVLTVDDTGLVKGVASGSTRVVAELEDGTRAEYIVTVMEGEFTIEYVIDYPDGAVKYVMNSSVPTLQTATDTVVEDKVDAIPGISHTLRDNTNLDCANYTVIGWKDEEGNEYQFGDTIIVTGNMTFSAILVSNGKEEASLTVVYKSNNGGTTYLTNSNQQVLKGVDADGNTYYEIRVTTAQQLKYNYGDGTFTNLVGFALNSGSTTVDVKQNEILRINANQISNNTITLYVVNSSSPVALFFVLKPSLTEHPTGNVFSNWYVVGSSTLKTGYSQYYHVGTSTADETVNNNINLIADDVPTIEEILAQMTGFDTGNSAYAVRWYNYRASSSTTDSDHIDGILYRKGLYHSIRYIDTYTGQIVKAYNSVEDGANKNLYTLAPAYTSLDGYKANLTFRGWFFDPEGTLPIDTDKEIYVYQDYTIYAVYDKTYTVQFLGEDGEDLRVDGEPADYYQVVKENDDASYPETTPTKPGYTFDGWYTQMGGQGKKLEENDDLLVGITANAVYYAHFTRDTGTLTVSKVVQNESGESVDALDGEVFTFRIDGFDPGSTVHYTVGSDTEEKTVTVSEVGDIDLTIGANQTITFTDAPTGTYKVTELNVKKGTLTANGKTYTVTNSTDSDELVKSGTCALSITNTRLADFSITVRKVWDDASDQDGKREPVTINLMRRSNGGEPAQCNSYTFDGSEDTQEHTFTNVDRVDADGNAYTYSVEEQGVNNGKITLNGAEYTVAYSTANDGALVVTNSYTPETVGVNVTKTWDDFGDETGYRPNSSRENNTGITLTLSASYTEDGADTPTDVDWSALTSASASQTINQSSLVTGTTDQWKATWSELPKYYNGHLITYTVSESPVPHYSIDQDRSAMSSTASSYNLTITNTIDLIDVTITKTVSGNMGNVNQDFGFSVVLYGQDGETPISGAELTNKTGTGEGKPTVTIPADNATTASFSLKHGQSVTLGGIPYGAQLGITESGKSGYVTTIGIQTDNSKGDSSTQKVTIVPTEGTSLTIGVTNNNTATIDTGVTLDFLPYVLLIAGVGIAVALWLVMKANKRKDD